MPITPRNTLKTFFQTLDKPTAENFWAIFDSFWHKSDVVEVDTVPVWADVPATMNEAGPQGQKAFDSRYLYIWVEDDYVLRTPLAEWGADA